MASIVFFKFYCDPNYDNHTSLFINQIFLGKLLKLALIGIGVAVVIAAIIVGPLIQNESESEPEIIKKTVDTEPKINPTKQPEPKVTTKAISEPSKPSCDPSYPAVCIPPYPPDLDCGEIQYSNFRVVPPDPHGFDNDKDGTGCEVGSPSKPVQPTQENDCDPSYPTVCISSYPPDLDCGEISYKRFKVLQPDPHGFDRDRDGIGCES